MKKIAFLGALVVSAFVAMGCQTIEPVGGATGKVGSRVGQASYTMLFGMFPLGTGDASVQTAAKNAGITTIGTIDKKVRYPLSPMLPVVEVTTIVTGE